MSTGGLMNNPRKPRWNMDLYNSRLNGWLRWLAMHPVLSVITLDTIP